MDPQLREAALRYFVGGKQWNYGRFLHHLDTTLPQYPKLRDKKLRYEIGQELWKSLLWEQAGNNTDQEKKLKALQELAKIKSLAPTSVTNNAKTNCTTTNNNAIASIFPHLGTKEIEAGIKTQCGGTSCPENAEEVVPPPPYEKPSPQTPKAECRKSASLHNDSQHPSSTQPSDEGVEIAVSEHHSKCDSSNDAQNPAVEITPSLCPSPDDSFAELDLSSIDFSSLDEFLSSQATDLLAGFGLEEEYYENATVTVHQTSTPKDQTHLAPNLGSESKSEFSSIIRAPLSSSYHLHGEIRYSQSTPRGRIPSFSEFDAIESVHSGYPSTQSLHTPSSVAPTPLILTPSPHDQRSLGVPTPRACSSPTPTYMHAPPTSTPGTPVPVHLPPPNSREKVQAPHPSTIISSALTATAEASQSLKRKLDIAESGESSIVQAESEKAEKAVNTLRKLLTMQKMVTEMLLDVLDDLPLGVAAKRQRQE